MCLALYLSADRPLPELAYRKDRPALHTAQLSRHTAKKVSRWLQSDHVVEVRSDEGCGCRFIDDDPEAESRASAQAALSELADYLSAVGGDVHLLACWLGDEGKEPRQLTMSVSDVRTAPLQESWEQPLLVRVLDR